MYRMQANVLSFSEVNSLLEKKEVIDARDMLEGSSIVKFSIELPLTIAQRLTESLGMDLQGVVELPARWIRGDTLSHTDRGDVPFESIYSIFLTDSSGTFVLGEEEFPIVSGSGVVCMEDVYHETRGTGESVRLLLGPMTVRGTP